MYSNNMVSESGDVNSRLTTSQKVSHDIYKQLKDYESTLLGIQRLLVWETPLYSALFIILLHLAFFYLFVHSQHIVGFMFTIALFLIWVDLWKHKIWPEIRAEPPDTEAEWGELNPRLFSIKEMCEKAAEFLTYLCSLFQDFLRLRKDHPGKFCLCCCSCCIILMTIGIRIPGVVLAYISMLCVVFWPMVWYHRVLERTYNVVEPFLMQLQYTLKQRRSETYLLTKCIAEKQTAVSNSDPDDDISEFIPVLDEKTAAVLAKAITDDSELSETDEEILSDLPSFSKASTGTLNVSKMKDSFVASLQNQGFPKVGDYADHDEEDNFGLPSFDMYNATTTDITTPPLASGYMEKHLGVNAEVMANALGGMMKNTLASLAHSVRASDERGVDAESTSSVSDYEFVVLSSDEDPLND